MRDFVEHHISAKQKVAAVPEEMLGNVRAGLFSIGFLDESVDSKRRAAVEFRTGTDIAITRRGVGRSDTESHYQARGCGQASSKAIALLLILAADHVVRGPLVLLSRTRRDGRSLTSISLDHSAHREAAKLLARQDARKMADNILQLPGLLHKRSELQRLISAEAQSSEVLSQSHTFDC